jgi:predicted Zn-dependent protease
MAALVALLALGVAHAQPGSPQTCDGWQAEISSVEGTVEVQRANRDEWRVAAAGEAVCMGDSVRVQAFGRATVRLPDQSVLRLDERTTLTLSQPADGIGSIVELIRGVIHVISRDPRSLRFTTPYANAGLEGTEFDLRVDDAQRRTEVAVLEGKVAFTTPGGRIDVPSGYTGLAREGGLPESRAILEPIELMRWASYFPEVLDRELPAPDREPASDEIGDASFFAARAAARLRRGNLGAANADLDESTRLEPGNATALALRVIVAVGRNDLAAAREQARAATAATPSAAAAYIAESYALQADGDLDGALASGAAALAIAPDNAIAWARRAEIELGRGQWAASLAAAMRATDLRPDLGYAGTVLGFVRLGAADIAAAIDQFERAATLDQGAPLPHLGLALALMQRGDFVAGRQQLEIAVALDPANALTRSYMAKTYDAENRETLPATQFELAKRFRPNDPTPWLYDALVQLNRNRPVDALQNLLGAISRNHNRALFRSRLAMDADLATRSGGAGRVLRELGFEQLALVRGWSAAAVTPSDYAAHRMLADVYSARPRYEIARVSELYTSQLLQPANLTPIQPQLGQQHPTLFGRAAPSELAFSELVPLVTANGLRLQASTVVGANETLGEDVALAGLRDRLSYSVGQFHYETDGFRANNDFEQTIANAFVQYTPSDRSSVQAELRSSEVERGDLTRKFDSSQFSELARYSDSIDTLRVGAKTRLGTRGTLLSSIARQDVSQTYDAGPDLIRIAGEMDAVSLDTQYIRETDRWNLRTGVFVANADSIAVQTSPSGRFVSEYEADESSAYAYADIALSPELLLTAGASADTIALDDGSDEDRLNPKVGLTWTPTAGLTFRLASFETLAGALTTSKQNAQPRLEPVVVAGFNQFLYGANADAGKVRGIAVDGRISEKAFAGLELVDRKIASWVLFPETGQVGRGKIEEKSAIGYFYWTPRNDLALSAHYQTDRTVGDRSAANYGILHARTRRLPLEARYFSPTGLTAGLRASLYHQRGDFFEPTPPGQPILVNSGEDRFWIVDASLGYRLPKRRGVLSLNVDNVLDKQFRFQDIDPENPSITPERMAYFRFTLAFD